MSRIMDKECFNYAEIPFTNMPKIEGYDPKRSRKLLLP